MKCSRIVMLAVAAAAVAGCAGGEGALHQTVSINTEPAGAACLLTGGAEALAELPATPGAVRLPQSPRDVRVFCTSPGRAPVAATLPAETEAKQVVASVLIYGAAPAAIGTLMGTNRRYPPALTVTLPPMRFASAEERDRFFAAKAEESRRHFDQPIRANKGMCRADEFGCQHMIAGMERAKDEELARLEALRAATAPSP